jgi:competence protein ComEC
MQFFLAFLSGVVLFYSFQYFPSLTLFGGLLSFIWLSFRKRYFLILVVAAGAVFAVLRYEPPEEPPHTKDEVSVNGVFESYPVKTARGSFKQTLITKPAIGMWGGERPTEFSGGKIILYSNNAFEPGTECELGIKFMNTGKGLNPGENGPGAIRASLIDTGTCNQRSSLHSRIEAYRYRINEHIESNFKQEPGALVESITTGQKSNINEELRHAFNAAGLTHILSISGTHFGLFSIFLFGIFRFIIGSLPYRTFQRITIYLTPSQAAAILCLPVMLAYLALSGASIPAIRSFIMISLFLFGLVIGRKGYWLNSLLFAAFILVIWDPQAIFTISFQLSFLAVLCIGLAIPDREVRKTKVGKAGKAFSYAKNVILMTLSASVGTAPLVAYYFHYFSVISTVSNLFIAPFIGLTLIPLSVVSCFLFLITGHFIFTPVVSFFSDVSIMSVKLLSHIPFAAVNIPAFPAIIILLSYGGFIFYFMFGRRRYLLIIPFIPFVIYFFACAFEEKSLNVTYLDVGQGDSSVVELPDGKTMVIDTGRTGRETASFLKLIGKDTIDILVLSHIHPDHIGGLDDIRRKFSVKEIWDNGRMVFPGYGEARSLKRGDMLEGKGYRIYALHPYPEFYTVDRSDYVSENNDSLVLKIEGNSRSFLFTGDVEEEAEEDVMHLGMWIRSSVIKVPHHGGRSSANRPFLKAVSPDIAVISVGRDNVFGHPHEGMLDALRGARILRTDKDGAIKIEETADGLHIKTYKDFLIEKTGSLAGEIRNFKRLFETW